MSDFNSILAIFCYYKVQLLITRNSQDISFCSIRILITSCKRSHFDQTKKKERKKYNSGVSFHAGSTVLPITRNPRSSECR